MSRIYDLLLKFSIQSHQSHVTNVSHTLMEASHWSKMKYEPSDWLVLRKCPDMSRESSDSLGSSQCWKCTVSTRNFGNFAKSYANFYRGKGLSTHKSPNYMILLFVLGQSRTRDPLNIDFCSEIENRYVPFTHEATEDFISSNIHRKTMDINSIRKYFEVPKT